MGQRVGFSQFCNWLPQKIKKKIEKGFGKTQKVFFEKMAYL